MAAEDKKAAEIKKILILVAIALACGVLLPAWLSWVVLRRVKIAEKAATEIQMVI